MNLLFLRLATNRRVWAVGAALVVLLAAGLYLDHVRRTARAQGRAEVQAKWDNERAHQVEAAFKAATANAAETERRVALQQEVSDAQARALAAARAAAADAVDAAAGLRRRAVAAGAAAASAAACNPAPSAISEATAGAEVVPADVFDRTVGAAVELAAEADRRGIAGNECVGRYDALMPR